MTPLSGRVILSRVSTNRGLPHSRLIIRRRSIRSLSDSSPLLTAPRSHENDRRTLGARFHLHATTQALGSPPHAGQALALTDTIGIEPGPVILDSQHKTASLDPDLDFRIRARGLAGGTRGGYLSDRNRLAWKDGRERAAMVDLSGRLA